VKEFIEKVRETMADNKEEPENTIADSDNVKKYKAAGEVVNSK
jgi:hypothetical protein